MGGIRFRRAVVLYGSETGCAEDTAGRIARALRRSGVELLALSALDDFYPVSQWEEQFGDLDTTLFVFAVATTGDGDPPRNMQQFWKSLFLSSTPRLQFLSFAVFGLGDSSYRKFCFVAKVLHNRLAALAATPVVHRALGDDRDGRGLDEALSPFTVALIAALDQLPYPPTDELLPSAGPAPPRFSSPSSAPPSPSRDANKPAALVKKQLPLLAPRIVTWRAAATPSALVADRLSLPPYESSAASLPCGCMGEALHLNTSAFLTSRVCLECVSVAPPRSSESEPLVPRVSRVREAAAAHAAAVATVARILRGQPAEDGRSNAPRGGGGSELRGGVVVCNEEVVRGADVAHGSEVRHIEIALTCSPSSIDVEGVEGSQVEDKGAPFVAGDCLAVRPPCPQAIVEAFATRVGAALSESVVVAVAPSALPPAARLALSELSKSEGVCEADAPTFSPLEGEGTTWADECVPPPPYSSPAVLGWLLREGYAAVTTPLFVLKWVVDCVAPPRTLFFETCAQFCGREGEGGQSPRQVGSEAAAVDDDLHPTSSDEREKLLELATAAGAPFLHEYATRERRTPCEVLRDFPSVGFGWRGGARGGADEPPVIPLGRLLEALPLLRERLFSVASGPWGGEGYEATVAGGGRGDQRPVRWHTSSSGLGRTAGLHAPSIVLSEGTAEDGVFAGGVALCVGVMRYKTAIYKFAREGLCSSYVARLQPGAVVAVSFAPSPHFHAPSRNDVARCLMVGTGTGVAPLRAIAWERAGGGHEGRVSFPQAVIEAKHHSSIVKEGDCADTSPPAPVGGDTAPPDCGDVLVHGFRWKELDCLYGKEWCRLGVHHVAAASRDTPPAWYDPQLKGRYHVQCALQSMSVVRQVRQILDGGGHVFVAGSARVMPQAVAEAVGKAALVRKDAVYAADGSVKEGVDADDELSAALTSVSAEAAVQYVDALKRNKTYHEDCWE